MKKILLIVTLVVIFAATSVAQKVVMANYRDTITGSGTKNYPATVFNELAYGSFLFYLDHISGTGDSTYCYIQGSTDNSTWKNLGSTDYANTVVATDAAPTDFKVLRLYETDAGMIWNIVNPLTLPYYRFQVIHYCASTQMVTAKGALYKKK